MLANLIARYCTEIDDSSSDSVGAFDGEYIGGMGSVADTGHGGTRAYLFDGVDDRIAVPNLFNSDGSADYPFTVMFWIKAASPAASHTWLGNYNGFGSGFSIGTYASQIYAGMRSTDGGGYASCRVSVPYTYTTWKHVTFSYDGSGTSTGIKIYLDGTAATTTDASESTYVKMSAITADVNIGSRISTQPFAGRMDDIMAFDAVKSAVDTAAIVAAGPGYVPPIVANNVLLDHHRTRRRAHAS